MKKTIRVALADDHSLFRKGLIEILSSFDEVEVLFEAKNGKLFIEQLSKMPAKERPDVCILDINMPVMSGYDTARHIRNYYPKLKVLALSMYGEEDIIIKMINCGANGYILKDTEPEELLNAIKGVHSAGVYHSDLVSNKVLREAKLTEEDDVVFTEKELRFLNYCCSEMTYKEIAEEMGISHRTVDGYRDNLFSKLNLHSRTGLVLYAIKTGVVAVYK
ncbi:MAG: response regulator transcription factor [Flavipsychrobacter sp.]